MDILNSDWLIRMIEKSADTPQGRMLKLFEILDDWLSAPQVDVQPESLTAQQNKKLTHYLSLQATKSGAEIPEMLANQLYFMAIAAIQEKLNGHENSLLHAKLAAEALINAQTKRRLQFTKKTVYASAAGLIAISIISVSLLFNQQVNPYAKNVPHHVANQATTTTTKIIPSVLLVNAHQPTEIASPEQTAALLARVNQMKKGSCQLIEAIQLPDAHKKVYFENVVLGQISTNPDEQRLANELLNMVRCNYTPMLMANSK